MPQRSVVIDAPPVASVQAGTVAPAAAVTWVVVVALVVLALGVRIAYVEHCNLIYDEYQHMHAAYLVSRGQVPFVDFFEHHTPLFYYLAAAIIPMQAPSFDTLIQARYVALSMHLLSLLLVGLWVRAMVGRVEALVAATVLAANFCFFMWGTRTYLDTYAAPLLIAAAWTLPMRQRPGNAFVSGLCFGLAVLITQKAAMVGLAMAVVFLSRLPEALAEPSQWRTWSRDLGLCVAGGVVAALLLLLLLRPAGFAAMIRDAIVLNLHWKARYFPRRELLILLASDGFVYLTALAGVAVGLAGLLHRRLAFQDADVPWAFLVALGLGVFIMPVVAEEYFILMLPFAAIVASLELIRCWRRHLAARSAAAVTASASWLGWRVIMGLFVVVSLLDWIGLRFGSSSRLSTAAFVLMPIVWGGLVAAAWRARQRASVLEAPLWLAVMCALSVVQQIDWIPRHPNEDDRARVEYIMSATGPNDPVFDGRSGYGVFRPHAYRYWFLHDEMQLMLSDAQKGPDIVRALEAQRVPIVIVDDYTRMLPAGVLDHIGAHYVDTRFPDIKRRRPVVGVEPRS